MTRRILFFNPEAKESERLLFWSDGSITDNNDEETHTHPGAKWLIHDGWLHYTIPGKEGPHPFGDVVHQLYLKYLAELILS